MIFYIKGHILRNSFKKKNMGQLDKPREIGCKPVDGVQVVLSSSQFNIAMFVHQYLPSGEQKWQYPKIGKKGLVYL